MDAEVTLEPLAVKRSTAAKLIDCGTTKVYELCRAGKLATIKVGADDRITIESIKRYVAAGGDR
jgi:excisionase family DNA binding protein